MKFSRNSRFPLSTFTAALMVFAWTGASHAGLWIASGTDQFGNPVIVDAEVVTLSNTVIQMTVTSMSPPITTPPSDLTTLSNAPLETAEITTNTLPFFYWARAFPTPDTLTLTSLNASDDLLSGSPQIVTITEPAPIIGLTMTPVSVSVRTTTEEMIYIPFVQVPEPSSIVLAAFGALGFVGYSLRRRIAI